MKNALNFYLFVLLLALGMPRAWAGKHPVPLDPKADESACVQCHQDKTKGKAVHTAIATGCLSCHEVRVNREVTRVKLITATASALCVSCHTDKKASDLKGRVHSPAVRDCLTCHDPHTSDNKNQLLKPTAGDNPAQNLCLTCHNMGMEVPKGGSRHTALDMGCDTCHVTHKTGDRAQVEFAYHLTKASPQLCLDCHDGKDEALVKAHQNQPFASADCLSCHDPHQSAAPKLMQKFVHMPFGEKMCDTCHQPPKDGKVVLTAATPKELCLTCHAEKGEQIDKAKVQHPGAAGDCTDCHSPHAGRSPAFPKPDAVSVCLTCHTEQAEQGNKRYPHQPAFQQGCASCHEPHGSDNPQLLRAAKPSALCLECHGPDRAPAKLDSDHLVSIFGGKVRLPDEYFGRVPMLPLQYGLGHPVDRHPVTDASDPVNPNNTMQINCLTCHQPHSSDQPNLLVKDQANNMAFCNTCHQAKVAEAPHAAPGTEQKTGAPFSGRMKSGGQ